jgi:hypothetical protein
MCLSGDFGQSKPFYAFVKFKKSEISVFLGKFGNFCFFPNASLGKIGRITIKNGFWTP